ncbi:MAG TPA: hypothetical protein VFM79_03830 [Pelobium sp.]|nr:hypothetical protein [Pelobium sp.]
MKKFLLIAAMCLPFIGSAQIITVPNGDFETPANPTGTNVQNWAGDWYESNADVQIEINNQITGVYSVRLVGAGASNERSITTANADAFQVVTGNTYKVTFNWRIQTAAGPSGGENTNNNTFTAKALETDENGSVNGAVISSVSTTSGTNEQGTFNFTITNATPKIKLQFTKDGGIAYLDDVTLENLGVLPVTLSSFVGEAKNYGVKLNWTTASETNNQYFEVLRAGEDKNFVPIGRVNGAINSSEAKTYSFDDIAPLNGTNYYQLKQVDVDGKSESFDPIAVKFGLSENSFKVLSSSESSVVVSISSSTAKKGIISYVGLDGRVLYNQRVSVSSGLNTFTIPVDKSNGEIGVISFASGNEQKSIKLLR